LGAFADAASDARRALATATDDDPSAALVLGDALRLGGDEQGARAAYEDALRRDPANARAQRALARLAEAH
ncbi:MAG: tetratricopeptide repeat protein, partial [Deltaproteobacteria bacterium]|nr:tetratricopeptide repeat protein [Deltaproteobacteria bacterium]